MKMMTEERVAEILVKLMDERRIEPDEERVAAGGKEWGHVAAWALPGYTGFAVKYGDNGATNYVITDEVDLPRFLLGDGRGDAVEIANARDCAPDGVGAGYTGPVSVVRHGNFSNNSGRYSWVCEENTDTPREYTVAEAREWVDAEEGEVYVTQENECARPDYYIVPV